MKPQSLFIQLCLIFQVCNLFGQDSNLQDRISLLQELFGANGKTNISITGLNICPPQYTNEILNTNLFTTQEQKVLSSIFLKYQNITTNSGPLGSVLASLTKSNSCWLAHFNYTNSDSCEDIIFGDRTSIFCGGSQYDSYMAKSGGKFFAKYRTRDNAGYDVIINAPDMNGISTAFFVQIKDGCVNGLSVTLHSDGRCNDLLHFGNGKAINRWLQWDENSSGLIKVKIKTPLDYFKYMNQEIKM